MKKLILILLVISLSSCGLLRPSEECPSHNKNWGYNQSGAPVPKPHKRCYYP